MTNKKLIKKHVHKYRQVIQGSERLIREQVGVNKHGRPVYKKRIVNTGEGRIIYRCILPGCSHFVDSSLIEGRKSICWKCEEEMVMTKESARLVKPRHHECRRGVVKDDIAKSTIFLEEILRMN